MVSGTASFSDVEGSNAIEIKYRTAPYVVGSVTLAPLFFFSLWMEWSTELKGWTVSAICAGGAVYCIWRALDRRPVVVLDEKGLRDRRLGFVHWPWSRLKSVDAINDAPRLPYSFQRERHCGVMLHFDSNVASSTWRGESLQSSAFLNLLTTQVGPAQFVEYVRRYAPHVMINTDKLEQ
jgi:hypothetical protein